MTRKKRQVQKDLEGLMCFAHKKKIYKTKKAALTSMNKVIGIGRSKYPLGVYKCNDCHNWHITKNPR